MRNKCQTKYLKIVENYLNALSYRHKANTREIRGLSRGCLKEATVHVLMLFIANNITVPSSKYKIAGLEINKLRHFSASAGNMPKVLKLFSCIEKWGNICELCRFAPLYTHDYMNIAIQLGFLSGLQS